MSDLRHTLTCHQCGARHQRVVLQPGEWARCARCEAVLEQYSMFTPSAWLAVVIGAMMMFIIANAYPVATLYLQGSGQPATFMDAIRVTWDSGYPLVAIMTFAAGFLFPILHLAVLLWVLGPMALGKFPLYFESAIRLIDNLKPWCMVPVFLMGVLVSVVKLAGMASLKPGIGLFAIAVTTVLMTSLLRLSSRRLRFMASDLGLPAREEAFLKAPSPRHFPVTWALLLSACFLYFPANLLPVMNIATIAGNSSHTIMGGVVELWQLGSWDIALIVFIASVAVPLFKLIALGTLVYLAQKGAPTQLKARTHLYHVVEFIGQWSMLDVFVVILLSALGRFGSLLDIEPGMGAAAFGGVVVMTMLAALGFDPRLAWRRAGHRGHLAEQQSS